MTSAPLPILLPAWSASCLRCDEQIEYRCTCRAFTAAVLGLSRGGTGHAKSCAGLPERCPRCKAPRWLEAPRWRRGQGKSADSVRRRAIAKRGQRAK